MNVACPTERGLISFFGNTSHSCTRQQADYGELDYRSNQHENVTKTSKDATKGSKYIKACLEAQHTL